MAGHSKWANIKHRKARVDAVKGRVTSKCIKAIIVAAKSGGGDPAMNLALRYAIDEARASNVQKSDCGENCGDCSEKTECCGKCEVASAGN